MHFLNKMTNVWLYFCIITISFRVIETYPRQDNTFYEVNNFPYRYIEPRDSSGTIDYHLLPKFEGLSIF